MYDILSEINDFLQSGCYESPLDNENVNWFVDEIFR